jgi:hypothetical protein
MIISEVQNKTREAATISHRAMTEPARLGLFAVSGSVFHLFQLF